jgi:hypothetical protein
MRENLLYLAQMLQENGEGSYAAIIEDAISGSDRERDAILVSNELWGGSGSIADQTGLVNGRRTEGTRRIQRALI